MWAKDAVLLYLRAYMHNLFDVSRTCIDIAAADIVGVDGCFDIDGDHTAAGR